MPESLLVIFDLKVNGHANSYILNNVSRALVDRLTVKFAGEIMQETDGHDLFKLYEDLFLTENERVSMFSEGIQSVDLSKISCSAGDKKKSGVAKENKLNDVYQNKYRIHWILRFLKIMEPFSQELFLMSFSLSSGSHPPAVL